LAPPLKSSPAGNLLILDQTTSGVLRYQRVFEPVIKNSINGNSLSATGPHDVYVMRDVDTGQIYHFGETGRGWEIRGNEWVRQLKKEYGLDTEPFPVRTGLNGKKSAKELQTRLIKTYEKIFGKRPFFVDNDGNIILIQKTYQ